MKQIVIPVKNEQGTIANVSQTLANAQINIETIDAEAVKSDGVIILTVDHYDRALRVLRDAGYRAITEDAIVLKLRNEPGALAQVARRLKDAGLGIRSLQIVETLAQDSLVTLVADDPKIVRELLSDVIVHS